MMEPGDWAIQLGDVELWENTGRFLDGLNNDYQERDLTIILVPGNHDDWEALTAAEQGEPNTLGLTERDEYGMMVNPARPAIRVTPRALVWERDGVRYAALSGAASVMFAPGGQWSPLEVPLPVHAERLAPADVLLTHECSTAMFNHVFNGVPHPESTDAERAAMAVSRRAVDRAREVTGAPVHLCGHLHRMALLGSRPDFVPMVGYGDTLFEVPDEPFELVLSIAGTIGDRVTLNLPYQR